MTLDVDLRFKIQYSFVSSRFKIISKCYHISVKLIMYDLSRKDAKIVLPLLLYKYLLQSMLVR